MYENIAPVTKSLNIDPDELAAALAVRQELGPQAEAAAIVAFLERTGHAIDARVDQRVAAHATARGWGGRAGGTGHPSQAAKLGLALGSMAMGIPLSGIATQLAPFAGLIMLVIVWLAILAINISFHRSGS